MDYSILVMAIITGGSIATAIFMWLLAGITTDNADMAIHRLKSVCVKCSKRLIVLSFSFNAKGTRERGLKDFKWNNII